MMIERKQYVDKLLSKSWNGKVKIVTGIRRCGKSFLLRTLYKQTLMKKGVKASSFIEVDLEKEEYAAYRNPVVLADYVRERTTEKKAQETFSLRNTGDFCRKIVVLDGSRKLWTDEDGVMYVGVIPFLLDNVIDVVLS